MAAPNFDAIPEELKALPQWVLWRTITRAGKLTKIPFDFKGREGDSADPTRWESYPRVVDAYNNNRGKFDGIGFTFDVLDPYAGVDLDNCINEDGSLQPRAKAILGKLNSYSEISPSGKGVKVFLKAKLPVRIRKGDGKYQQGFESKKPDLEIEIYYGYRFFTLTGNRLTDYSATIEDSNEELTEIFKEIFKSRNYFDGDGEPEPQHAGGKGAGEPVATTTTAPPTLSDEQIIALTAGARNADKFLRLMGGDTSGYKSESEADGALAAILAFYSRDQEQILRIIKRSKLNDEKWDRKGYQDTTIGGALELVKETYSGDPGREEKVPSLGLEEIEVGFKADPDSITTPGALAGLRSLSPFKLAGFFKKLGITGDQRKILLDLLNAEESTPEEPKEDPAILAEAERILGDGKAFEYILEVWQKRHHGDENLGKGLFLSTGAQSCISSRGVHVHACGPRGSGKSDGAEKASEAMPGSHLLVGSASPKALYYLGERLPAGAVVYLDDIGWNDQAAQMFKTCTTFYRTGATHTVVLDQEIRQFRTAPRIIFWLTTTDDQTDEQIRDRLLRIDVTETPKHTAEVIDFIFKQRKSGAAAFDSREIEVCRAIIHLLKRVFVDVVIPFTDSIRFEGDPRGATIFADLVSAFAVWRHRIRARDSNGAVIACYEDYKDTETFFNAIKGHGDTKYTPRELRVLQAIKDLHGVATREMVMAKTRLSKGDLSDILNGRSRDGQAKYGLFHKCAALTEDEEGTSTQLDDSKKTRTSIKKKILRLPADYDVLSAYGKAVYLADETTIKRTCSAGSEQFGTGSEIKNEFGKDVVRKFVEYNIIRERRTPEHHPLSPVDTKKIFFVSPGPKMPNLPNLEPSDSGSPFRTKTVPTPNHPNPSIKEQREAAERERAAREEHFKEKAEQHRINVPKRFSLIYQPKGEAAEYSAWGLNLVESPKPGGAAEKLKTCSNGCLYCYNRRGKKDYDSLPGPTLKPNLLERLNRDLPQVKAHLKPGERVHLTFVGDLYDREVPREISRKVLELFKEHGVPFQVLTKNPERGLDDLDLYFDNCRFGTTLTFDNDEDSRIWEPNASLPAARIDPLKIAHSRGIFTWVSLEPVIDPAQTLGLIAATAGFVDFFGVGKLNHDLPREDSVNWCKFRGDAEKMLKNYHKDFKIKEALRRASQEPRTAAGKDDEPEEIRFLARFRTPYKTEWPRGGGRYESVTYQAGEECVVPLERALQWRGRGVVDLVEVVLPWEPSEEATA